MNSVILRRAIVAGVVIAFCILSSFTVYAQVEDGVDTPSQPQPKDSSTAPMFHPDSIIVDGTFVTCSDTTESLLILGDGRVIYGLADQAILTTISKLFMEDLITAVSKTRSVTSRKGLDSCATLGLIVNLQDGPRYLLINNLHPSPKVKDVQLRVERIRKIMSKKLESEIQRMTSKMEAAEQDTVVVTPPSLSNEELRMHLEHLLVAQQWHCRGTVTVTVMVGRDGKARRAFVSGSDVPGKCSALLSAAALRGVLLSQFTPAKNVREKPVNGWLEVKVPFSIIRKKN